MNKTAMDVVPGDRVMIQNMGIFEVKGTEWNADWQVVVLVLVGSIAKYLCLPNQTVQIEPRVGTQEAAS